MPITAEDLLRRIESGETRFSGADMRGAKLDGLNIDGNKLLFSHVNFDGASFRGATFSRTNFLGSTYIDADLTGATFDRCILIGCDLFKARCRDAKFFGGTLEDACLIQTDFSGVLFAGTSLENALIGNTLFDGSYLGMIRDLDKVQYAKLPDDTPPEIRAALPSGHLPNQLDMDTITRTAEMFKVINSNPDSDVPPDEVLTPPDVFAEFLINNSIGDKFIDVYWKILSETSEGYESVFISYSMRDQQFADFLYDKLHHSGIRAWYAPKEMEGGKTVIEQVRSAIHTHDRVLLVLSKNSLGSNWVSNEIRLAYKREREGAQRVLFPIRLVSFDELREWELLDADVGVDLAHHVRSYFIPDFSAWPDRESSEHEIRRLVKALKKKEA
jgi:hypothetical protein